jgi:hypothetical protein
MRQRDVISTSNRRKERTGHNFLRPILRTRRIHRQQLLVLG